MPTDRLGVLAPCQSNGQGSPPNTTEGGADFAANTLPLNAAVRFFASDNFDECTSVLPLGMVPWANIIGDPQHMPHFGPEQMIGQLAVAAGWTSNGNTFTLLKASHNGTNIAKFCPGGIAGNPVGIPGVDWYRHHRMITLGRPRTNKFKWYHYGMQGESDCDNADGSLAQANALGANQLAFYYALATIIGQPSENGCLLGRICVNVWGAIQPSVAPYVPNGIASQNAIAAANPGLVGLVDNDGRVLASDNLHYDAMSQHAQGADVWNHPTNGWKKFA